MSHKKKCSTCLTVHWDDELCPNCNGNVEFSEETDEKHIPYTGPLPAYDPQVQEDRDFWARRIGREAANDLSPETDDKNGGLRR
jgi:hypothetical protein